MRLLWHTLRTFPRWERPAQVGFVLAVLLLAAALVTASRVESLRTAALIGAGGLLLTAQGIVLWANRGLVSPYTQAQRAYLAGDFDEAIRLLSRQPRADYRTLTLLGNAYRQIGRLPESAAALKQALDQESSHHFPLYGFGRTLLAEGQYAEAAHLLERALAQGAPPGTQIDLAEAWYRVNEAERARTLLLALDPRTEEPYRALMARHLLHQLGAGPAPDAALVQAGRPFWERSAAVFHDTPYGQALAEDLRIFSTYSQE